MENRTQLARALCVLLFTTAATFAGDWSQWRGPNFDGSAEASNLPASYGPQQNVMWSIDVPGPSGSTPIVHGDRVFISSFDTASGNVVGWCIDRLTGKRNWEITLGKGQHAHRRGTENFYASPSPVTDGEQVVFLSGNGDIVAVAMDGKERWRWNIQEKYGKFNLMWGYASSPLLHADKLYVPVMHQSKDDAESYLLVVDAQTGKVLHRVVRATDAPGETKDSYATPIPRTVDGKTEILLLGADKITAHDPDNGSELWRFGDWNPRAIGHWRHVQSPVVDAKGHIYFPTPKDEPVFAINIKDGRPNQLWLNDDRGVTNDVPVPLFYKDRLYLLNGKKKVLNCINPKDGSVIWSHRFDCKTYFRASPTAGDDKIYLINADGESYIMAAGDEAKQLHHATFGGYPARSSIAIAHDNLYIRTSEKLYCISNAAKSVNAK